MFKYGRLAAVVLVCLSSVAFAQNLCPPGVKSDKLICLIPQVYGINGLVLEGAAGHFKNDFLTSSLQPLNSAVGRQAVLLPLASPSSGLTFAWDPGTHLFVASTDSFGPILSERAETIGKYRLSLELGYQFFKFGTQDGVALKAMPVVFSQADFTLQNGVTCSAAPNGVNTDFCGFIRDVIKADNRLDLKTHQFTTYITFGLTDRIDLSAIIPIENVRMAITSNANIVNNAGAPFHSFQVRPDSCTFPCTNQIFSSSASATGIGDMTLRIKGMAWKGTQSEANPGKEPRAAVAIGVDIRVPTGDELNLLGSGAAGVRPFIVWSYRSKFSPHAFVGYETNGSSKIAGDVSTGSEQRLPSQLAYSGGVDIWVTKRVTVALDIIGQQVFQAGRLSMSTFTELGPCPTASCVNPPQTGNVDRNISQSTGSFNTTGFSIGGKIRPFSNLLITGNILVKLNDGGLRTNVVPLAGVSYTF